MQNNPKPPVTLSRRALLAAAVGGFGLVGWYAFGDTAVSVPIAPDLAQTLLADKSIVVVDIRRPDEWALTGIAAGAVPLDMRDDDFTKQLERLVAGDKAAPIALICARGVRSRRLAAKLKAAGFSGVLDISEGMLGSAAGPGWIARRLPVVPYK